MLELTTRLSWLNNVVQLTMLLTIVSNNVVQHWWSNNGCSRLLKQEKTILIEHACSLLLSLLLKLVNKLWQYWWLNNGVTTLSSWLNNLLLNIVHCSRGAAQHCSQLAAQHCSQLAVRHCSQLAAQHCSQLAEQHCSQLAAQHCLCQLTTCNRLCVFTRVGEYVFAFRKSSNIPSVWIIISCTENHLVFVLMIKFPTAKLAKAGKFLCGILWPPPISWIPRLDIFKKRRYNSKRSCIALKYHLYIHVWKYLAFQFS